MRAGTAHRLTTRRPDRGVLLGSVAFARGPVQAVVDAVGVEQSIEIAAGLRDLAVGPEPGRAQQQRQFGGSLVSGVHAVRLHRRTPQLRVVVPGVGQVGGHDGAEQRGYELGVRAAEGDQRGVPQPEQVAGRLPGDETGGDSVEDRRRAAQRRGGDQGPVAGEMLAQQRHPVPMQDIHSPPPSPATTPATATSSPGRARTRPCTPATGSNGIFAAAVPLSTIHRPSRAR